MGYAYNIPRINKKGGGVHAEIALLRKYGKRIAYIQVVRASKTGTPSRISICESCVRVLIKLRIKII